MVSVYRIGFGLSYRTSSIVRLSSRSIRPCASFSTPSKCAGANILAEYSANRGQSQRSQATTEKVASAAKEVLLRGLDKGDEFEADRMGVVIAARAGYDPFGLPSYTSSDGTHWTAQIPCVNGGSTSRPAKPGEVPGEAP